MSFATRRELLDFKPRHFTAEQCLILCNFADMVVKEMYHLRDLQRREDDEVSQRETRAECSKFRSSVEASSEGVVLLEMSKEKWPVVLGNEKWVRDTGMDDAALRIFQLAVPSYTYSISRRGWPVIVG